MSDALRAAGRQVQAAVLRVPGVAAAAVVPVGAGGEAGDAIRLIAFYVSEYELASLDLHDLLSARLPRYLIPTHYVRLPELPVDDQRLSALAEELAAGWPRFEPPRSEAEQRLATIWAEVLGMAAGRIGRYDNFFDLGGTSLAAIHLVMRLDQRLCLTDVLARPTLHDQAGLLGDDDGAVHTRALLHHLNPAGPDRSVLVCFPDAGGNAVNFQRLADTAADRLRIVAVEPPGHDLARPAEDLVSLAQLADRTVRELAGLHRPYLWGQGAGAAAALLTAQIHERAGAAVAGVLVAWDTMSPGTAEAAVSDDEAADRLGRRAAYVEVAGAAPGRLAFVARAYRHDWAEAAAVLDRLDGRPGLAAPVTEVTLGPARPRLRTAARHHLLRVAGDLAREDPEAILTFLGRPRPAIAQPA
jgi:hypothetical protein